MMTKKLNNLAAIAGVALLIGGCASNSLYKPGIEKAAKDGVFYVDLRDGPFEMSHPDMQKTYLPRLLKENCILPENTDHPFCKDPYSYVVFSGHVSTGFWANGPQFLNVVVPKEVNARGFRPPSEKDGDIIRVRIIPGPISMFVYDGIIERYDDPNRGCKWEGSHNYSGGVVCPKYGYTYKDLDQSKFR